MARRRERRRERRSDRRGEERKKQKLGGVKRLRHFTQAWEGGPGRG